MKEAQQFIRIARSFEAAEALDESCDEPLSPDESLSELQMCREQYYLMKYGEPGARRKRLRRVLRVIKQK